jgi:hypothetical protein
MANARTILPEMVSVSRICPLTRELHQILSEKLEGYDFEVLHRWLQIVEQENKIKLDRERNNIRFK